MSCLPVLFISHGAPTYALAPGIAGAQLTALGQSLPRPAAVLVVSPHWMTPAIKVGAVAKPATIHDFGGFEPALYEIDYPAQGHPALAARTLEVLAGAGLKATLDARRGLDHGAWVPLRHLYPNADVPVFQVSMPARLEAASAYSLGRALAPLADEGVLIVCSGSMTHNLHDFRAAIGVEPAYAKAFVAWVREAVMDTDHERLLQTLSLAPNARRAHPSAEHFLPLLVAAGSADTQATVELLDGGFTHGSLSMESYAFGANPGATRVFTLQESSHV